jgi:hypothetical protein
MNESSQSLHFWKASADRIRAWSSSLPILTRFVATNSRWSCALTYDEEDAEALALSADGLVLLWMYDDDYVLELQIFRDKHTIGSLSFRWRRFGALGGADLPVPVLTALRDFGVLSASTQNELTEIGRAVTAGEIRGDTVRDRVATLLNLAAYERLSSAACFQRPLEEFRKDFPAADDLFE